MSRPAASSMIRSHCGMPAGAGALVRADGAGCGRHGMRRRRCRVRLAVACRRDEDVRYRPGAGSVQHACPDE